MEDLFTWFWLLVTVTCILYTLTIIWFTIGWSRIKHYKATKTNFGTRVSVIVAYRNEEKNIENCLIQLCKQTITTKEYQIIAINDHSTDNSEKIVSNLTKTYPQLLMLNSKEKGKKQALNEAIYNANGELIVTTDADCTVPNNWLKTIVSYWEDFKPKMLIGAVVINEKKGFFQKFQYLEFNSLIMSAAGACGINHPIMCNGANLAFCKKTYLSISDPYNNKYFSGDDVFLLHNIKKIAPEKIHFIKSQDTLVKTNAKNTLRNFINQRERWVSKANGYKDNDTKFTAFIVFFYSLLFFVGLFFSLFYTQFLYPILFLYLTKTAIDYLFFQQTNDFFQHKKYFYLLPVFEFIYLFYPFIIGVSGLIKAKKYQSR